MTELLGAAKCSSDMPSDGTLHAYEVVSLLCSLISVSAVVRFWLEKSTPPPTASPGYNGLPTRACMGSARAEDVALVFSVLRLALDAVAAAGVPTTAVHLLLWNLTATEICCMLPLAFTVLLFSSWLARSPAASREQFSLLTAAAARLCSGFHGIGGWAGPTEQLSTLMHAEDPTARLAAAPPTLTSAAKSLIVAAEANPRLNEDSNTMTLNTPSSKLPPKPRLSISSARPASQRLGFGICPEGAEASESAPWPEKTSPCCHGSDDLAGAPNHCQKGAADRCGLLPRNSEELVCLASISQRGQQCLQNSRGLYANQLGTRLGISLAAKRDSFDSAMSACCWSPSLSGMNLPCDPAASTSGSTASVQQWCRAKTNRDGEVQVLVVDDCGVSRLLITQQLSAIGLSVLSAGSGLEALQLLEDLWQTGGCASLPALITMDIDMPGISGSETVKEIRRRYQAAVLPIIAMAGVDIGLGIGYAEEVQLLLDRGFDGVICKADLSPLCSCVCSQLNLAAVRSEAKQLGPVKSMLDDILPARVTRQLQQDRTAIYEELGEVTVLFTDIVGFTSITSSTDTKQLINMLHELYSLFDALSTLHDVYKVETIGDAYMCVAGHTEESKAEQAHRMVAMAKDMVEAAATVRVPGGGCLKIRVGVHTGPAFGGVVGTMRPRYCLFGDTVNVASRMESTSFPRCIQVSRATFIKYRQEEALGTSKTALGADTVTDSLLEQFVGLPERDIKGKGAMATWLVRAGDYRRVSGSSRKSICLGRQLDR